MRFLAILIFVLFLFPTQLFAECSARLVRSIPKAGTIDHKRGPATDTFELVFSSNDSVTADCFSVTESGSTAAPQIIGVSNYSDYVEVSLSRPITSNQFTTLVYTNDSGARTRIDVAHLFGDFDGSRCVNGIDHLRFIDCFNGVSECHPLAADMDRSGAVTPLDILVMIDSLNFNAGTCLPARPRLTPPGGASRICARLKLVVARADLIIERFEVRLNRFLLLIEKTETRLAELQAELERLNNATNPNSRRVQKQIKRTERLIQAYIRKLERLNVRRALFLRKHQALIDRRDAIEVKYLRNCP